MYDYYIALDWAQSNMAIAYMTKNSNNIKAIDIPADLDNLKAFLQNLRGKNILTIEETTTTHWLYVELLDYVDEILICDPYRNKLLSEGPQNDKIDAIGLVKLLKANLLKPVYHCCGRLIELRKLTSAYNDLVQRGVRLKNQKSALLRSKGKQKGETLKDEIGGFVIKQIDAAIENYEADKTRYEEIIAQEVKKTTMLRHLDSIPGIGKIGALKIGSTVVNAERFSHRNYFQSYVGLVRLELVSGGRSYGSRLPRHRRDLKGVFKTAALNAVVHNNCFSSYYRYLTTERRYSDDKARHAVARLIATSAYGVMKSGKRFNPKSIGALKALST